MGEQSGARIGGDDYQHLYSWYLLLLLLPEDSVYHHAYVEHPKAGAADDVTLHPKDPAKVAAKYYQVKWHVKGTSHYDFKLFTEIKKPSKTSLLQKLFNSWKGLTNGGEAAEVWLVSNWSYATDIGPFIRENNELDELFHNCSSRSKAGRAKKEWRDAVGATESEMGAFCRDLRFRLGFAGTPELESNIDDRMARYGLKSGQGPRDVVLGAIRRLIKAGGEKKKVTRESLIELIDENDLWAEAAESPKASLTIHGWTKEVFDTTPTVQLDWTAYIDRDTRRVPSQEEWLKELQPELNAAKKKFHERADNRYIDFRGKLPLTTLLAIGAVFPDVGGFAFRTLQPTGSENNLWRSDTTPTQLKFEHEAAAGSGSGDDVVVFLAVSGSGRADAERFFNENRDKFSALIYAEPDGGGGQAILTGAGDAVALANHAKELIRKTRSEFAATRIHLVLYAPASFCLFLGQKLNAIGTIITYERDSTGGYQESLSIATG
ncbi:MAG: SAVED domain-containing protein [Chloracidobacterium sp.]|nr:SAVED domain-containing protein [Chloracidobacterium sp.]